MNYINIDNDEEDNKKFPIFLIIVTIFLLIQIFKIHSFDNTVLKNVDMQPFSEPIQETIENGVPFKHKVKDGEALITPLAKYKIYGRVYAKHHSLSKFALATMYPYDIAIFFGDFQYKEVYKCIKVHPVGTFIHYSYSGSAMKNHLYKYFKKESMTHCFTNNHLCPANKNVLKGLKKLQKKDVVYIEGYLIKFKLQRKNGRVEEGVSSTVRNDKEPMMSGNNGNGTCEQIYVTRVVSRHGDYK